ncbi:hypothetical protein V7182_00245 [Neobacillus drentensis]|uniref:hypothetical protein n=1 Tax=Neobacillus drentensis TaxID=220684 RepID=UPI003000622C
MRQHMYVLFACMLLSLVACTNIQDPNLSVEVHISKLTKKEFRMVGTKGFDHPTINDFRKFTLDVNMEHTDEITSRTIRIPNGLEEVINTIDRERYSYGGGFEQDNKGENFAKYRQEFVFYSKGLSESDMKKAFDPAVIRVSWVEQKTVTKEFVIGDIIQFN